MASNEKKFWEDLRVQQENTLVSIEDANRSLAIVERKKKVCERFINRVVKAMINFYFDASVVRPDDYPLDEQKCNELLSASLQGWLLDTFPLQLQKEVNSAFNKHNASNSSKQSSKH